VPCNLEEAGVADAPAIEMVMFFAERFALPISVMVRSDGRRRAVSSTSAERPSPGGTAVRMRYLLRGIIALVRSGAVVQGEAKPKEHQQHGEFGESGRHGFR
jgi:hypothetical protein